MKKFILIGLFMSAAGCTTSRVITGPDGSPHVIVTCRDIEQCYADARHACLGNYQIVNTSSEVHGDKDYTGSYTNLLVKCKR